MPIFSANEIDVLLEKLREAQPTRIDAEGGLFDTDEAQPGFGCAGSDKSFNPPKMRAIGLRLNPDRQLGGNDDGTA